MASKVAAGDRWGRSPASPSPRNVHAFSPFRLHEHREGLSADTCSARPFRQETTPHETAPHETAHSALRGSARALAGFYSARLCRGHVYQTATAVLDSAQNGTPAGMSHVMDVWAFGSSRASLLPLPLPPPSLSASNYSASVSASVPPPLDRPRPNNQSLFCLSTAHLLETSLGRRGVWPGGLRRRALASSRRSGRAGRRTPAPRAAG